MVHCLIWTPTGYALMTGSGFISAGGWQLMDLRRRITGDGWQPNLFSFMKIEVM
jgi:hypothetical protein